MERKYLGKALGKLNIDLDLDKNLDYLKDFGESVKDVGKKLVPLAIFGGLTSLVLFATNYDMDSPAKLRKDNLPKEYKNMELIEYDLPTKGLVEQIELLPLADYDVVRGDGTVVLSGELKYCVKHGESEDGSYPYGCEVREGYVKLAQKGKKK
jgi:hypothetical protein